MTCLVWRVRRLTMRFSRSQVMFECSPSVHWVCRECLAGYLQMKISAREVTELCCPVWANMLTEAERAKRREDENECVQNIDNFVVEASVDEAHVAKYRTLLLEQVWAVDQANVVHCPACSFMTQCPLAEQKLDVVCQNDQCETERFCGLCGFAPHSKAGADGSLAQTCAQFAAWKAENDGAAAAFEEYMQSGKAQVCPHCKEACEKEGGCNFMYCKCKLKDGTKGKFCLHCGRGLDEKQHISHFGKYGPYGEGCVGGKKDDKGHVAEPACAQCQGYVAQKTECACGGWQQHDGVAEAEAE